MRNDARPTEPMGRRRIRFSTITLHLAKNSVIQRFDADRRLTKEREQARMRDDGHLHSPMVRAMDAAKALRNALEGIYQQREAGTETFLPRDLHRLDNLLEDCATHPAFATIALGTVRAHEGIDEQ